MLSDLLVQERDFIERRTREVFLERSVAKPSERELQRGVPIFLEQLTEALRARDVRETEIGRVAARYGERLFRLGFTVSEVVHGYGAVCEVVTQRAEELGAAITVSEFEVLNRTLDVAIADSVTEYQRQRDEQALHREAAELAQLAHELRNSLSATTVAWDVIRRGMVGVRGKTADVVELGLSRMRELLDRAMAEARLRAEAAPDARG